MTACGRPTGPPPTRTNWPAAAARPIKIPTLGGSSLSIAGALDNTGTVQAGDAGQAPNAATATAATAGPTLTTLVSFNGANGRAPLAGLIADAAGDLFGTTSGDGATNFGTVFEIAKTGGGYAGAPTTLVSFNGANGSGPAAGLIADAAGDLFGTTLAAGRTATARCSRSPRPAANTPARRPRWSASTALTGQPRWTI